MRSTEIVTLANRPNLAPTVADWIWREWGKRDGYSFEETLEYVAASSAGKDIPQTFVLLVDGEPVGTSSLVAADMKERPNLTPWMANVFVVPTARRQKPCHSADKDNRDRRQGRWYSRSVAAHRHGRGYLR